MKVFIDTEFIDDKDHFYLLSIGLKREDGATYYAELDSTDRSLAGDWVKKHVLPLMKGPIKNRDTIASEISQFCGTKPEFYAYFCAFDWVLLCRLFGGMLQVPSTWPHYCHELMHIRPDLKGIMNLPKQTTVKHHALNDAEWNKEIYDYLMGLPSK